MISFGEIGDVTFEVSDGVAMIPVEEIACMAEMIRKAKSMEYDRGYNDGENEGFENTELAYGNGIEDGMARAAMLVDNPYDLW
jgi:hypothetical protein